MMTQMKTLFSALALTLTAPLVMAQSDPAPAAPSEASMLTVNVKGMVCDFCAQAVQKVFGKNDAVEGVHVDLDKGEIHVGLKPGMKLSDDEVETLVKKSGYAMISGERDMS